MNKQQYIDTENYQDADMSEFPKIPNQAKQNAGNQNNLLINLNESFIDPLVFDEFIILRPDSNKHTPYVFSLKQMEDKKQTTAYLIPHIKISKNPFFSKAVEDENQSYSSEEQTDRHILYDILGKVQNNPDDEHLKKLFSENMIKEFSKSLSSIWKNPSYLKKGSKKQISLIEKSTIKDRDIEDIKSTISESEKEERKSNCNELQNTAIHYQHIIDIGQQQLIEQNQKQFLGDLPEAAVELKDDNDDEEEGEAIYKLVAEDNQYNNIKDERQLKQYFQSFMKQLKGVKEESRYFEANKDGGKECSNQKIRDSLRKTGKKILKQIGKKIISGDFDLTTISFPIKCMIPKTGLQKALNSTCLFPVYINEAARIQDPVERLKLVICATLGGFYLNLSFLKPLNPILGETCEAFYPDGTQLYAEQISHHPPVSYFLVIGPQKCYTYSGNYNYESNAGLNSLSLKNKGKRTIRFHDGSQIEYNFAKEVYSGVFWSTTKVESMGTITFQDTKNNLVAKVTFDDVSRRPTDFFKGKIKQDQNVLTKIYGSYMGFCEFDGVRYWDYRYVHPFQPIIKNSVLGSDCQYRKDKILLERGYVQMAQDAKVEMESQQREDKQLRKNWAKKNKQ